VAVVPRLPIEIQERVLDDECSLFCFVSFILLHAIRRRPEKKLEIVLT
jgi:hypothetical protein